MREYEILGPQNDGEPVAVADPAPDPEPPKVDPPEPEVKPEDAAKPEDETPEQIEEKKRQTGSARAKAKAERLAEENRQLQDRLTRLEAKVDPKPAQPNTPAEGKPKLDDFESFEAFNEALTDWKVDQKLKAKEAEAQTQKMVQSWEQKKAEARKEFPDLDEVLADMEPPSGVVLAVMAESDHTAKIAYHLGQHPEELKRINQLAPPAAALAIAEIALQFKAVPTPPAPKTKVTNAPPPIAPLSGTSTPAPPQHRRDTYVEIK